MDKKLLLSPSLAILGKNLVSEINAAVGFYPQANKSLKADGSPVTDLDFALSGLLEKSLSASYPEVNFYSEEEPAEWSFPLLAVDPLDGTREYIQGISEWAVSIGYFASRKFKGEGWVYNPKKNELFDSNFKPNSFFKKTSYQGEVSRSEWERGLYSGFKNSEFKLTPRGSIAYKLGRLATSEIDFVVSLAPKNIWDIAGGSLLCQKSGVKFYSEGNEVTGVQKIYLPPLIWCRPTLFKKLSLLFPY